MTLKSTSLLKAKGVPQGNVLVPLLFTIYNKLFLYIYNLDIITPPQTNILFVQIIQSQISELVHFLIPHWVNTELEKTASPYLHHINIIN